MNRKRRRAETQARSVMQQALLAVQQTFTNAVQHHQAGPFDLHCPMLSMPLALETILTTIPSAVSYLHADAAEVEAWRLRLAAMARPGPRIGLVWAGNPRTQSAAWTAIDRRRSLAPARLAPLFGLPGSYFFNLQGDGFSLQGDGPAAPDEFPLTNLMDEMADFADTAALIANLDLVFSVDTAVVHLAAALGKPVWMLDRFDFDWRWLVERRDSPWKPTLRLYRQLRPGHWDAVLAGVVGDLRCLGRGNDWLADTALDRPAACE